MGDPEKWVRDTLDAGKRIMGFGHRVYRAEDPRSRILKRTAQELGSPQIEIAEQLEEAALAELERRHPERPLKTNVEYYSALVLDVAEIPPPLAPAMFACSRVAGWSAHILEQKRTGRLFRPSARYVGPGSAIPDDRLTLAEAAARADALAGGGERAGAGRPPSGVGRRARGGRAQLRLPARAVAYRAVGQFRFRQKMELLRRGLEDESPAAADPRSISLELLSRDAPGGINAARPLLHRLVSADDNQAVRRLAVVCLRNGSPQPRHARAAERACRRRRGRPRPARVRAKVAAALRRSPTRASHRPPGACQPPRVDRFVASARRTFGGVCVRMGGEVRLAAPLVRHVRVELGGGEVGVPEHLLDAAEVGAALEQMRRERVAKEMRVHASGSSPAFSASRRRMRNTPARVERPAFRVEEQLRRLPSVQMRPPARDVAAKRFGRLPADRARCAPSSPCRCSGRAARRGRPTRARARPPR